MSYRSSEGYGLVNHFGTLLSEHNLAGILDPQVAREGGGEVIDIALLAAMCVKLASAGRPTMRQVEMALEGIYAAKDQCSSSSDVSDDESGENHFELDDDASASPGGARACTTSHVELRRTPAAGKRRAAASLPNRRHAAMDIDGDELETRRRADSAHQ